MKAAEKMEWRTIVEVAKVLPDDATITQKPLVLLKLPEPFVDWFKLAKSFSMWMEI